MRVFIDSMRLFSGCPSKCEASFSGCPSKKAKTECRGADNLTGCVARNRAYARLNREVPGDRALRELPLAGPRAVSERLSRGKGYFRGKPKIASMRNGRDCDLQSRPLRFEALIFGLPLKKGQLKATSRVIIIMNPAITPHVPRCG